MLYCLAVEEDPINRPTRRVEGRGLGNWASGERTALFSYGHSEGHASCETPPLSRNSRSFKVRSSGYASAGEASQPSRGSAVYRPRLDFPLPEGRQDLRRPSLQPTRNRTASKE